MALSLDRLNNKGVTDALFGQLEDAILSGKIVDGEKLPSEQSIAEQAGVGRRAVREALKALEMKGLIEIRRGSGAYVIRSDLDSYIDTLTRNIRSYLNQEKASLDHVLLFRTLIEGGIIRILATDSRLRSKTVPTADRALERQQGALAKKDASAYNEAHFDYHFAIVNSVENPIISMMYSQVMNIIEPYMRLSASNMDIIRSSIAEHRKILDAIRKGNPAQAYRAFQLHLKLSEEHLQPLIPSDGGKRSSVKDPQRRLRSSSSQR